MHKVGETTPLEGFQGNFGEFDEQCRYTYKTGDYSPEKYMNDKYKTNYTVEATVNGNSYSYLYDIAGTSTENPTLYNLLFEGTAGTDIWSSVSVGAGPVTNGNFNNEGETAGKIE